MVTYSFNEYIQVALIIKQNFELKQRIKKLEVSLNDLWGEMSELRELLECFTDEEKKQEKLLDDEYKLKHGL